MIGIVRSKIKKAEEDIFSFFKLVKKQQEQILFSIEKNDNQFLLKVLKNENEINKIYFNGFKNTIYNLVKYKLLAIHLRKILAYSYISNELERIGDYIYNIGKLIEKKDIKTEERKKIVNLLNIPLTIFSKIESLFFVKNPEVLVEYLKDNSFLFVEKFSNKNSSNDYYFNYHFFTSVQRISDHLKNIVEYLLLIRSFEDFKKYSKTKF